jgi:hypothetical protein
MKYKSAVLETASKIVNDNLPFKHFALKDFDKLIDTYPDGELLVDITNNVFGRVVIQYHHSGNLWMVYCTKSDKEKLVTYTIHKGDTKTIYINSYKWIQEYHEYYLDGWQQVYDNGTNYLLKFDHKPKNRPNPLHFMKVVPDDVYVPIDMEKLRCPIIANGVNNIIRLLIDHDFKSEVTKEIDICI